MDDARTAEPGVSLDLLDALHRRLVLLLRAVRPEDFARTFRHPERVVLTLDQTLPLYAWHCRHHLAHITHLAQRMGWYNHCYFQVHIPPGFPGRAAPCWLYFDLNIQS